MDSIRDNNMDSIRDNNLATTCVTLGLTSANGGGGDCLGFNGKIIIAQNGQDPKFL